MRFTLRSLSPFLPLPYVRNLNMVAIDKPCFLPREGLYIDPIVAGLRNSIFHPLFTLSCLYLAGRSSSLASWEKPLRIVSAASILLWLNDWLSTRSRNNWVTDDTWDWKKELVVVTGGSGGIGAGVSQRLAALGSRVVVLDIIPLTFKPGNLIAPQSKSTICQ